MLILYNTENVFELYQKLGHLQDLRNTALVIDHVGFLRRAARTKDGAQGPVEPLKLRLSAKTLRECSRRLCRIGVGQVEAL